MAISFPAHLRISTICAAGFFCDIGFRKTGIAQF